MKIQLAKSKRGKVYWRVRARNGRIRLVSEEYNSLRSAQESIEGFLKDIDWYLRKPRRIEKTF